VHKWAAWQRTVFFSGIPILCSVVGWPLGVWMIGTRTFSLPTLGANAIAGSVLLSLVLSFVFHQFFAIKGRQIEAEKRAAEAQLRLLQGQIEPHFLFNTLAGVLSLIDHEPAKAKQMLQDFTEYLRASLGSLRNDQSPLSQELDLAEHYLRLLGARMEDRLHWRIDADAAARRISVPPLLLQPLVENAIHHGLEPQLEGGSVTLSAHVQGGQLVLQVQDDGRGPDAPPRAGARKGSGLALANIRERLLSRYGSAATLELQATHPGTRVVMRLPLENQPI
jgi:LytS/YehU family sensor histidine kinase